MVVNRLADEVDLTLLVEGRPAAVETVRLPTAASEDKLTERLLGEVNRTAVVAMQNERSGGAVERVYILGSPAKRRWLADRIRDDLLLPVTVVDPFIRRLPTNRCRGRAVCVAVGNAPRRG